MLLRVLGVVLVAVFALSGCGPSAAQIKAARTARYRVTPAQAFQAGVAALAANDYKVVKADPVAGRALTKPRWYEPDGTYVAKSASGAPMVGNGAILFQLEIAVVPDGDAFRVDVIPHVVQHRSGGVPYPLLPDDPAMPGWGIGKIENVYLSIYSRLKQATVTPDAGPPGQTARR